MDPAGMTREARNVAWLVGHAGVERQDVAQDVMVKVLRAESRGQVVTPAYVRVAARNRALDELRRVRPLQLGGGDVPVEGFEDAAVTRLDVQAFVERQRPGDARILRLLLDGYTIPEAAAEMGIDASTVRRHLYRMRHAARLERAFEAD